VQGQQTDKEYLKKVYKETANAFFSGGETRKREWLSGIIFNYAFIGMSLSYGKAGCSWNIETVPSSDKRLYVCGRSSGKKVIDLVYIVPHETWAVPAEWIIHRGEELYINLPEGERTNGYSIETEDYGQEPKGDEQNKVPFLASLYEVMGKQLAEGNRLCLIYLFLFFPSVFEDFCNLLPKWEDDTLAKGDQYKLCEVICGIFYSYLNLLEELQPLTKTKLPHREICNILNRNNLRGLSEMIESEFLSGDAQDEYVKSLKDSVRNGILKIPVVKKFNIETDNSKEGRELEAKIAEVKKKAENFKLF